MKLLLHFLSDTIVQDSEGQTPDNSAEKNQLNRKWQTDTVGKRQGNDKPEMDRNAKPKNIPYKNM